MKKGGKILGLLMIALSIFGLAMFWSAADENTGVTAVRISPLLIALAAVAGLAMCGGLTRQGAAVSLLRHAFELRLVQRKHGDFSAGEHGVKRDEQNLQQQQQDNGIPHDRIPLSLSDVSAHKKQKTHPARRPARGLCPVFFI